MFEPSDEILEQFERDEEWKAGVVNTLVEILEEVFDHPKVFAAEIAGVMLRHGLALNEWAKSRDYET